MFSRKLNLGTSLLASRVNKMSMHLNVQKEKFAMAKETSYTDIAVKEVRVVEPVVFAGSEFHVDVTVFAPDEDFEDGVAYRLYVFLCPCGYPPKKTPEPLKGHVQDAPWDKAESTIRFTGTAGSAPGFYEVRAVLLEGPSGIPEPDDPPSIAEAAIPIIVI
jgi:hypothetical protein